MRKMILVPMTIVACAGVALAVPVEKWVQTTRSDFENGEAKGTAILAVGQIVLAPELKPLLEKPVSHIWALAVDSKGTVYAATGTEPKLLRLRGDKADTFFTSPDKSDIEVLAVAIAPDGAIYAATAPSGTLYRITPDGKATAVYKGSDPYIWSLAIGSDGTIYAATGPKAKLLKITPKGKASTLLEANASHILSLILAPDGTLYAGTDKNGLLYQVSAKGAARVVYDAAETDIRALAFDPQGRLYFATASTTKAPTPTTRPTTRTTIPSRTTIIIPSRRPTITRSTTTTKRPIPSRPTAPGAKLSASNRIYRLSPNGDVTRIATVSGVAFYALAWHNGHLYAATGNDGKLYRIERDRAVQLADLEESQILSLAIAEGRLLLATANPGRIYHATADHAASGTLLSEVYDTSALSRWGRICWQAHSPPGTSVTIATRTGNTTRPDKSWSAWSAEHTRPQGQRVTSPVARFIQYRATLKTSKPNVTPVLDEVAVAYIQGNRRPVVTQVQIIKPPKPRRPTTTIRPSQPSVPRPIPSPRPLTTRKRPAASQRGPFADRIRIMWQATDPNKDGLLYALYFRGEGETTWKKIRDRLTLIYCDWDTHAVPDGHYRIRVVASDVRTNPPAQALEGERITEAFYIDNTPPAVTELNVRVGKDRTVTVSARSNDVGGLAGAEYSIDAGEWVSLVPADGIFDSNTETLEFKTKAIEKGEHTIVVRAKDEAENTGAAKAVFVVK